MEAAEVWTCSQKVVQTYVALAFWVRYRVLGFEIVECDVREVKVHIWLRSCQVGQKFKASYAFDQVEFQQLVEINNFRQGVVNVRQSQTCQPEFF